MADGGVFVVGVWRSGTSLLYALLNQHPDIALMYEADLPLFWPLFTPYKKTWPERINFWNSAFDRHRLADAQDTFAKQTTLAGAAESVYREFARRNNARVWGDKSPTYPGHCARLARLFPKARFIFIWRDPEQICSSVLQAARGNAWFARRGMITRALFSTEHLKNDADWLKRHGRALYEISYDRLTTDCAAVMQEVAAFLAIPFDPRMATLAGADRSAVYEGDHHALVKSEGVIRRERGSSRVSGELKDKIRRYQNLWSRRYGDQWPLYRREGQTEPTISEKVLDRSGVLLLRALDCLVLIAYSYGPILIFRIYRKLKRPRVASMVIGQPNP